MSGEEAGAIERLQQDLRRPGGGWTTGILTLLAVPVGPFVGGVTTDIVGWVWMLGFLMLHLGWGAYGYYPRGLGR